jgi:hypothetical protein
METAWLKLRSKSGEVHSSILTSLVMDLMTAAFKRV